MKAEYVNAFLTPSVTVIQRMAGLEVKPGPIARLERVWMGDNVSVSIGLQGYLSGSVILTAPRDVALRLASRVAGEEMTEAHEEEVGSILAELANTVVGNATGHLYEIGVQETITPPTVITGDRVRFDFQPEMESLQIPLETEVGRMDMIVSLTGESPGSALGDS